MFKWFKKRKKEEDPFEDLKKDTLNALTKLKSKKFNDKKSIQELNKILRIYLEEKYNFKKGLLVENLLRKLKSKKMDKKTKLDISEIIIEIYKEEFSLEKTKRRKFNNLIKKTKSLIKKQD